MATVEDLAAQIHTALLDALAHQERAGFLAPGPGLVDEAGEVWLSLEQIARIAAQEATAARIENRVPPQPGAPILPIGAFRVGQAGT